MAEESLAMAVGRVSKAEPGFTKGSIFVCRLTGEAFGVGDSRSAIG